MAHTPGPWRVTQDDKWPFEIHVTSAGDESIVDIDLAISSQQNTIADCMDAVGFDWNPKNPTFARQRAIDNNARRLADGHLIAAAPELYAALSDLMNGDGDVHDKVIAAKNALLKVEGR